MKIKHALALTAILATCHVHALTPAEMILSCPPESGFCPTDAGGGGGDQSTFLGSWMGAGSHWDSFVDKDGEWDIETRPDGSTKVYFWDKQKTAFLIKKPMPGAPMKRSALVTGPFTPSLSKAQIKAQAEEQAKINAAKAAGAAAAGAAAQAASQKAAADAAANRAAQVPSAVPVGILVSTQPVAVSNAPIARHKP